MLEYVVEAFRKDIAPFVSGLWDSVVFWRTLLLVVALLIASVFAKWTRFRDWILRSEIIEHDRDLFRKYDSVASESDLLENWLHEIHTQFEECEHDDGPFQMELWRIRRPGELCRMMELESNRYLTRQLQKSNGGLHSALTAVREFFMAYHSNIDSYELEDGSTIYYSTYELCDEIFRSQLIILAEQANTAYRSHRRNIKKFLHI